MLYMPEHSGIAAAGRAVDAAAEGPLAALAAGSARLILEGSISHLKDIYQDE